MESILYDQLSAVINHTLPYLALVHSFNLSLSPLLRLVSLPPVPRRPEPLFFFPLLAHPILPFPSSFSRCGLVTGDTREGFWWGPIKAYKPRLYRPHVFYNASLEAFSKFSGLHSWWLEIYCFSLRRKWMLHLCHFNGSLIMSGRIPCASFY